jgi:GntR family transcriptional regulator
MDTMKGFKINEKSGVPVWVQLRRRLIYQIATGQFQTGEQLPTVREAAADLGINYNTVSKVYNDLERDGYIETKRGLGSFVAQISPELVLSTAGPLTETADAYIRVCEEQQMDKQEMLDYLDQRAERISQFGKAA